MNHPVPSGPVVMPEEGIELRAIVARIWRGKWIIIAIVALACVLSVLYALSLPNVYRAYSVLAPNQSDTQGGLNSLAAQYGGLASLAGVNLGTSSAGTDSVAVGLEVLGSRQFLADFIERHDLLIPIMAGKSWDDASDSLTLNAEIYDAQSKKWVRKVRAPRQPKPSLMEAQQFFADNFLTINQDKKTGFVTVSIVYYSPQMASDWTTWLVEDLNNFTMGRDVREAEQAIAYLQTQIEATPLADLRNVFFRLIEEQTKTIMLAEVSEEYLLRTLDPATPPEFRAAPRRAVIVLLAVFLSGIFGVMLVLALGALRPQR